MKRPADINQLGKRVVDLAVGETSEKTSEEEPARCRALGVC